MDGRTDGRLCSTFRATTMDSQFQCCRCATGVARRFSSLSPRPNRRAIMISLWPRATLHRRANLFAEIADEIKRGARDAWMEPAHHYSLAWLINHFFLAPRRRDVYLSLIHSISRAHRVIAQSQKCAVLWVYWDEMMTYFQARISLSWSEGFAMCALRGVLLLYLLVWAILRRSWYAVLPIVFLFIGDYLINKNALRYLRWNTEQQIKYFSLCRTCKFS